MSPSPSDHKKSSSSRSGQTLVEALIALSILTMGFIGIISLLTKSFQLNRTTADDTQATYLAAEGIEVAKSLIDHDVYSGLAVPPGDDYWDQCFLLNPTGEFKYYRIEYDTTTCPPTTYPGPNNYLSDPLYFNPTTGFYTYNSFGSGTIKSDFTREVKITAVSQNELDVQSTVTWNNGLLSNTITLEDHFYDYHPL
jgi:hypothetical protein